MDIHPPSSGGSDDPKPEPTPPTPTPPLTGFPQVGSLASPITSTPAETTSDTPTPAPVMPEPPTTIKSAIVTPANPSSPASPTTTQAAATPNPTVQTPAPAPSQTTVSTTPTVPTQASSSSPQTPSEPAEPSPVISSTVASGVTQTIATGQAKSHPKFSRKKLIVGGVLLVFILSLLSGMVYFAISSKNAKNEAKALRSELEEVTADIHKLPPDAEKVSECVPNMGYHYLEKGGSVEFGPFFLVNKAGDVIGLEFMYSNDMFTAIPSQQVAIEVIKSESGLQLNDWQFTRMEISRLPQGHPLFERDHVDIHLYTVSAEVQAKACE